MTYAAVILLSVVFTFLGFALECIQGNIVHVKHGREPNAGAAIFPGIPFIPLTAVAFTWFADRLYPNLGCWIVVVLFVIYVPYWLLSMRRLNAELASLIAATGKQEGADRLPPKRP